MLIGVIIGALLIILDLQFSAHEREWGSISSVILVLVAIIGSYFAWRQLVIIRKTKMIDLSMKYIDRYNQLQIQGIFDEAIKEIKSMDFNKNAIEPKKNIKTATAYFQELAVVFESGILDRAIISNMLLGDIGYLNKEFKPLHDWFKKKKPENLTGLDYLYRKLPEHSSEHRYN